jgi:hypothetical protein
MTIDVAADDYILIILISATTSPPLDFGMATVETADVISFSHTIYL